MVGGLLLWSLADGEMITLQTKRFSKQVGREVEADERNEASQEFPGSERIIGGASQMRVWGCAAVLARVRVLRARV